MRNAPSCCILPLSLIKILQPLCPSRYSGAAASGSAVEPLRALRCQKAENEFCHSPCGIMDQYISSCGLAHNLLLIDCESNTFTPVPMNGEEVALIVANSSVTHSIGGGEFAKRVEQSNQATEAICPENGLACLKYATEEHLEKAKGGMDEVVYKCVG